MHLDRPSIICGALISYLITTATQAIALSIDHSGSFYFSSVSTYVIAILMIISASLILKGKNAGFITAMLCLLTAIIWHLVALAEHPSISSAGFWTNIGIYITALFLAAPYAIKKKRA